MNSLRTLFADPVTHKELSGIARRWQTYLGRILYVGLIAVIVYFAWEESNLQRRWVSSSEYAKLGRLLFSMFVVLQMICVTLSAVSAASDLVTREVRGGTLGLLSLTPLSPWRIAAGKWKAAMAQAVTVILCGVPVAAICVYLGGVDLEQLVWSIVLSLDAAALGSATALLYSSLFRAGYVAVISALLTLGLYTILPLFLVIGAGRGADDLATFFCWIHPGWALIGAMIPLIGGGGPAAAQMGWMGATPITAVMVLVLLHWTAARLKTLTYTPPGPSVLARTFEAMDHFYEDINPKALKGVKLFAGREGVWQTNAILWKELKTRASGKLRNATRIALGMLLFFLLPLSCVFSDAGGWQVAMLWLSAIVFLFMAMANGVSLFVKEKEERKWDILLSTPLTSWEIVRAKLLAGLAALSPLGIILLFFWTLLAGVHGAGVLGWGMTLLAVALPTLLAYLVGAAASLRAASLRGAFTVTFGIMMLVLVIFPLLVFLFGEMSRTYMREGDFPMNLVMYTNPAPYLEPFSNAGPSWHGGVRHRYEALMDFFPFYVLAYAGGITLILVRLILGFDRATGRTKA